MSTRPQLLALASALLVVILSWHAPQGFYMDPAWQLNALRQYLAGQSPTFNTLVQADPTDLSRDRWQWISHWPPLMGLMVWGLSKAGASMALAVRILAAAGLLVGSLGWARWMDRFALPSWFIGMAAASIPLFRYANNPIFSYSTEGLAFALGPWILLGAERLARRWSVGLAVATGVLLGGAYWAKYSLIFVSLGAVAFLIWRVRWKSLWAAVPCFVLIGALNLLNRIMGDAASLVTEIPFGVALDARALLAPFAFLPLAMADLGTMLYYLSLDRGYRLAYADTLICLLGVPGAVLLMWLLRPSRNEEWLATFAAAASMISLAGLWLTGRTVSYEARHLEVAAIGLIPFAAAAAYRKWPGLSRTLRATLTTAAVGYLVIPVLCGIGSAIVKWSRPPLVLLQPLPRVDVVCVSDPVMALSLEGRKIITWGDFPPEAKLGSRTYRASVPMRVGLVMPAHFERDGKGNIIRNAFPQARGWQAPVQITRTHQIWVADLVPDNAARSAADSHP